MGMFDIFTTKAPEQTPPAAPVPVPTGQGNIPPVQQVQVDPNNPTAPIVPVSVEPKEPDSPLEPFKDLWQTEPKKDGEEAAPAPELTNEAVAKVMEGADFSSIMTPEFKTAIEAGGPEAVAAQAAMLNALGRQVLTQSTMVNNKLNTKAIEDALAAQAAKIPEMVRAASAKNHLNESNPVFSNPAIKPLIEAAQEKLLLKNPNATQAEMTKLTHDFMTAISEQFAPKQVINDNSLADATDWDKFLE